MSTSALTRRDRRPVFGLLCATGISNLGTRMTFLAVPWFVLATTHSALRAGLVAFAEMMPLVVVKILGGPVIDRFGARRLSILSDVVATVAMGAVPFLYALHALDLWILALCMGVVGAARGVGDTARNVLVPGVGAMAGMLIERTAGFFDGASRTAGLTGMPLAGALISVIRAPNVLAIDAATFFISALLVFVAVPLDAQPASIDAPQAPTSSTYLASLSEGFGYLRRDRLLVAICLMVGVANLLDQASGSVLAPDWAIRIVHSPLDLGLVGAAVSLGAVAGSAVATWLGPRLARRSTYAVGYLLGGAPRMLAYAAFARISPVLAISVISGLGIGAINPILGAVEYERVPRHLQARVLGAVGATAWFGIPFGSLIGGLAVGAIGLRPALVVLGCVYLGTTLTPFVFPVWRQMDRADGVDDNEPTVHLDLEHHPQDVAPLDSNGETDGDET